MRLFTDICARMSLKLGMSWDDDDDDDGDDGIG
jgi:hypothetical protein